MVPNRVGSVAENLSEQKVCISNKGLSDVAAKVDSFPISEFVLSLIMEYLFIS